MSVYFFVISGYIWKSRIQNVGMAIHATDHAEFIHDIHNGVHEPPPASFQATRE